MLCIAILCQAANKSTQADSYLSERSEQSRIIWCASVPQMLLAASVVNIVVLHQSAVSLMCM